MAHLIASLMALLARREQAGHAACSNAALALVIPFTTCAAQTARHAVTFPLQSSTKPCPTYHHQGYLIPYHHASRQEWFQGQTFRGTQPSQATSTGPPFSWKSSPPYSMAPTAAAGTGTSGLVAPMPGGRGRLVINQAESRGGGAGEQVERAGAAACCSLESWQPRSALCQCSFCLIFFSEEHLV